jgi:hypothetical protein
VCVSASSACQHGQTNPISNTRNPSAPTKTKTSFKSAKTVKKHLSEGQRGEETKVYRSKKLRIHKNGQGRYGPPNSSSWQDDYE